MKWTTVKRASRLVACAVVVAVLATTSPVGAGTYGLDLYSSLWTTASSQTGCDFTNNKLTAMAMALSMTEAGGNPPSAQTHGRWDGANNARAYDGYANAGGREIYFNQGIGLFQYDDSTNGYAMGTASEERIDPSVVGYQAMADLRSRSSCGLGNSPFTSSHGSYWYGCGATGSACNTKFQAIYDSSTNAIINTTWDYSMAGNGGLEQQYCDWSYGNWSTAFYCYVVRTDSVQGDNYWTASPYGTSPISTTYYSYRGTYGEMRVWPNWVSGTGQNVYALRPWGSSTVYWGTAAGFCANNGTWWC